VNSARGSMPHYLGTLGVMMLVGIGGILHVTQTIKGATTVIGQQLTDMMKQLDTLDDRSRMELLSQVDEQRSEMLSVLVKHLDTSTSKNVQAAAIYLIGRYRLSDGVNELIRRLDFDSGVRPARGPEPLYEQYPAVEALITIGQPSIPPMMQLLATDRNDLRRRLAVKVLRYVDGPDVAEFILRNAQAKETEPARNANLAEALQRLRKLIAETR